MSQNKSLLSKFITNKDRRRKRRRHDDDDNDDDHDKVHDVDEETEVEDVDMQDNVNEDWQVLGYLQAYNDKWINK